MFILLEACSRRKKGVRAHASRSRPCKMQFPGFGMSIYPVTKRKVLRETPVRSCPSLKLNLTAGGDGAKVTVGDPVAHGIRFFSPTLLVPPAELCTSKK